MKTPTWLYIPLIVLLAVAGAAFTLNIVRVLPFLANTAFPPAVRNPLHSSSNNWQNRISILQPEAAEAGLQIGDRPIAFNGRELTSAAVVLEELNKTKAGERIVVTAERTSEDGALQQRDFDVTAVKSVNSSLLERVIFTFVMSSFWILLPAFSFLLGFYVALVRIRDPLAWLLLLLMLSIGSIGFDGSTGFLALVQVIFIQFWGIWMLLFGIYFPERLELDRRLPWLKWLLIAPIVILSSVNVVRIAAGYFGLKEFSAWLLGIFGPYSTVQIVLMMIAIGLFCAMLGWKSGTLKNPDSRRRLRLLTIGTSLALLPSFLIIIYMFLSRSNRPAFESVPVWAGVASILAALLFPLSMAYVIVVQRAMDVSVVIRQGLQYALAKNGVLILQILLTIAVILTAFSFVADASTNRPQKIIFIALGVAAVFLIRLLADKIKIWTDKRFFREAYNSEQILSDLSEEVRTMVETKPLLETVSNKISESLHVPKVALLLNKGGEFQPAYALGFADAPAVSFPADAMTIEKLKKNEPLLIYADDKDSWINTENLNGEREFLGKLNSQLLLPVGVKEKLSGFLSLSPKKSEEPYSPTDLRLLKSVAAQTGLALENSRLTEAIAAEAAQRERLNREVEIAREVQERLFPQDLPKIKGLDYFGGCRPALGVGGDYYDFFELENGKFGIAIGDVSGKGIGASLMMASLQASLRGQAIHFDEDLAALMSNVNRLVYDTSTSNRYATFFYSQYDPATRKLTYVNAGHNPPFLFRKKGDDYELLRLEDGGAVVGMLPPMLINYSQGAIEMLPGDLLIGFTDGISEAMNPQDDEWGEERMIEAIKARIDLTAKEMFAYLVEQADAFANGAKQHDDMTAIIVRVV